LNVKNPVAANQSGYVNTFNVGKLTYIPVNVIPKTYLPIFKNKPVKATP
jgi:hypothetical protein